MFNLGCAAVVGLGLFRPRNDVQAFCGHMKSSATKENWPITDARKIKDKPLSGLFDFRLARMFGECSESRSDLGILAKIS